MQDSGEPRLPRVVAPERDGYIRERVRSALAYIPAERLPRRYVVGLVEPVAAGDAVAAQHDERGLYVVPRLVEDVMEREGPRLSAESALPPAKVEPRQ